MDHGDNEEEVIKFKLYAGDIKKYEVQLSQSVVKFSNLQFNESIEEGMFTI